jgi:hypothetical protein
MLSAISSIQIPGYINRNGIPATGTRIGDPGNCPSSWRLVWAALERRTIRGRRGHPVVAAGDRPAHSRQRARLEQCRAVDLRHLVRADPGPGQAVADGGPLLQQGGPPFWGFFASPTGDQRRARCFGVSARCTRAFPLQPTAFSCIFIVTRDFPVDWLVVRKGRNYLPTFKR